MSKILILAEHDNASPAPVTRRLVEAARAIGGEIHLLVAGENAGAAASGAACIAGVSKVLHADAPHYREPLAENLAPLLASLAPGYTHLLAAASSTGKDVLPRAAALLGVPQVSEAVRILSPDTFQRPIYAGNALETVRVESSPVALTVRGSAFGAAADGQVSAPVESVSPLPADARISFISRESGGSGRPELESARVVVSGGRGLGSAENFQKLLAFADSLGAAVGASRAAVDAGFAPNDWQVGQTGKIVAPELYIAVGISGAIQHLAGMKESRVIVAINKDENAPLMELADYSLTGDWAEILPALEQALKDA